MKRWSSNVCYNCEFWKMFKKDYPKNHTISPNNPGKCKNKEKKKRKKVYWGYEYCDQHVRKRGTVI